MKMKLSKTNLKIHHSKRGSYVAIYVYSMKIIVKYKRTYIHINIITYLNNVIFYYKH